MLTDGLTNTFPRTTFSDVQICVIINLSIIPCDIFVYEVRGISNVGDVTFLLTVFFEALYLRDLPFLLFLDTFLKDITWAL